MFPLINAITPSAAAMDFEAAGYDLGRTCDALASAETFHQYRSRGSGVPSNHSIRRGPYRLILVLGEYYPSSLSTSYKLRRLCAQLPRPQSCISD
jgi:hypothetical protein